MSATLPTIEQEVYQPTPGEEEQVVEASTAFFKNCQEITLGGEPTAANWCLTPLYQLGQNGKMLYWQVGFDSSTSDVVTNHGQVGGKISEHRRPVVLNKSGRDMQKQSLLKVRSYYNRQLDKGYHVLGAQTETERLPAQLAKAYEPPSVTEQGRKKAGNVKYFPVAVQAKVDGVRAMAYLENGQVKLYSRKNKLFHYLDAIKADLLKLFPYLPPGSGLDGEAYLYGMSFQNITKIANVNHKRKPPGDHTMNYYIFDLIIPNVPYQDRYMIMRTAVLKFLEDGNTADNLVFMTYDQAYSHQEIEDKHDRYVRDGFEGIMIRKITKDPRTGKQVLPEKNAKESFYRGKRNNNLLKHKRFFDEEGTIIGVYEEIQNFGGDAKQLAVFRVRADNGAEFGVRPRGTFEKRERWLQDGEELVGKRYTYRYQEKTDDGVPRFPVGIAFRDYE